MQDGLCAIPTNPNIASLNASCTNPHAPPAATPSFSRVTPVQHTKSPLQARELEIITLQKQLEALTKENIKLTLSLCEEQAEADDYKRECEVKIRDLEKSAESNKRKYDEMNGELTSFKEKAEEEAAKKKEEESRKAMTDAMSATMLSMIEKNNENLRLERRRELSEVDSNHKCFLM